MNSKYNLCFQIIFEAVRGDDFRSDIGIDDVKFEDGPCGKDKRNCFETILDSIYPIDYNF